MAMKAEFLNYYFCESKAIICDFPISIKWVDVIDFELRFEIWYPWKDCFIIFILLVFAAIIFDVFFLG